MTTLLFANNAQTTFSGPITNVATSLTLSSGAGALYPNPSPGQGFKLTAIDALTGLIHEIMLCTARSGDVCTVARAQEGTTAKAWAGGDLIANLVTAGSAAAFMQIDNARTQLIADMNYYVATTGSDSTGDGSIGNPWATLQFAYDFIQEKIDLRGFNIQVNVGDGTYTAGVSGFGGFTGIGSGLVKFIGNVATPANCFINSVGDAFYGDLGAQYIIGGFKVAASAGSGISTSNGALIVVQEKMDFGTCSFAHVYCKSSASNVRFNTPYTITGNAQYHYEIAGGSIQIGAYAVTLTGTRAFTVFAAAQFSGLIDATGATFTGTATGQRYSATTGGTINTNGGGANFFPGNAAGTSTTGYYV